MTASNGLALRLLQFVARKYRHLILYGQRVRLASILIAITTPRLFQR